MKSIFKWLLVALTVFAFIGCIETTTLVRVNKDGSGEVEETFLMGTEILQMLMDFGEPQEEGADADFGLLDKEKLAKRAHDMGEGVSLKSAEKISTEKSQGYKAVYSFSDINKLRVNQNPGENVPSDDQGGDPPKRELITFEFKKGSGGKPASLTIINPQREPEEEQKEAGAEAAGDEAEGMLEMFKQIFQDMKINVAVEVAGKIKETNATYQDGSTIVLMELDFSKIVQDEEAFKKLALSETESLEKTKEIIKDIPGIRVELQDRIEVKFK